MRRTDALACGLVLVASTTGCSVFGSSEPRGYPEAATVTVTSVASPSQPAPSRSATATTRSTTPTTAQAKPVALPDSGPEFTFVETRSGKTRCQISARGAGCQVIFDQPAPRTASGDRANGVNVRADGTLTFLLGNIAIDDPVQLDYRTYTARGWTIVANADGTRFTNDATGHGMLVATGGATAF